MTPDTLPPESVKGLARETKCSREPVYGASYSLMELAIVWWRSRTPSYFSGSRARQTRRDWGHQLVL